MLADDVIETINERILADGTVVQQPQGASRADLMAWAALALRLHGKEPARLLSVRTRLAAMQREDGRVTVLTDVGSSFWPTALAVLAWSGEAGFKTAFDRGSAFLLKTTGLLIEPVDRVPEEHDPSIAAWPWVEGGHTWTVPTATAVMALRAGGLDGHPRVTDGIRMLLDRQIPSGGWNYGNKSKYGSQLRPTIESTGYAMAALSGKVPEAAVAGAIAYLESELDRVRTPISLSWALMGLSAWNLRPAAAEQWLAESVRLQERYGPYDTDLLCQIAAAIFAREGLLAALSVRP